MANTDKISPWSDTGWVPSSVTVKESPCCKAEVYMSRGDGVLIGTCAVCDAYVARINPKTGEQEVPCEQK